jgi:hypothetical protein
MRRIILACALASVLAVPAKALDGARSPANVAPAIEMKTPAQAFNGTPLPPDTKPTFKPAPLDLPPLLLSQAANPGGTAGQGVDPLIGTWKFNPDKSTCNCPLPKRLSFTVVKDAQNMLSAVEGVDGEGRAFKFLVPHIYDGMPHPITGNPGWDSSLISRVGNTYNHVRFKQGKSVEVMQAVIVPGKTVTGTAEGITPNGQPYHYVYVYDRQ